MNLLVVGNGFDLAHGMPTRYSDFLDFVILYISQMGLWKQRYRTDCTQYDTSILQSLNSKAKANACVNQLFNPYKAQICAKNELRTCIDNNEWIRYFLYIYSYRKNIDIEYKWIDLETEIMEFLKKLNEETITYESLNKLHINILYRDTNGKLQTIPYYILSVIKDISSYDSTPKEYIKSKLFKNLFKELEKFSDILKYYLKLVAEISAQVHKKSFKINANDESIFIDHILNFNYTDTPLRYRHSGTDIDIDYVNGSLETPHIILGIENPDLDQSNSFCNNNIHLFFKNVQRVAYDMNYTYSGWVSSRPPTIKGTSSDSNFRVYIIGHSLDITDKYILNDVILNANYVTIYYYNEADKQSKIRNLYKLLGDEQFTKLINNSSGHSQIELKKQSEIIV
jgi:hypothetical protein